MRGTVRALAAALYSSTGGMPLLASEVLEVGERGDDGELATDEGTGQSYLAEVEQSMNTSLSTTSSFSIACHYCAEY